MYKTCGNLVRLSDLEKRSQRGAVPLILQIETMRAVPYLRKLHTIDARSHRAALAAREEPPPRRAAPDYHVDDGGHGDFVEDGEEGRLAEQTAKLWQHLCGGVDEIRPAVAAV